MKKLLCIMASALALTACATSPVTSTAAKQMPKERILAYGEYNPEYAEVEIIRDSGFASGGCYVGVMYRNEVIGRFDVSEKGTFYIPEGEWSFAIVSDPSGRGLCGVKGNPAIETQKISKDKKNIFRISFGPYRRPRLLPL